MANSAESYFLQSNKILKYYTKKKITRDDFKAIIAGDYMKILKTLMHPAKLPIFLMHLNLIVGFVKPPVFPGLIDFLNELKKNNIRIGILTANYRFNVVKFLKNNDIDLGYFEFIEASSDKKFKKLSKILKKIDPVDRFYFIGDESKDMIAAVRNKGKGLGVSWGFNSRQTLFNNGAVDVFNCYDEILDYIKKEKD